MRRRVLIAGLAAWLALVPAAAQARRAPRIVTLRDNGARLTLPRGAEVQLRLPERYRWLGPRVRGRAVRLTPIDFIRDPGYLAWAVTARRRGNAVVRASGYGFGTRECKPVLCAARRFRVTFLVR